MYHNPIRDNGARHARAIIHNLSFVILHLSLASIKKPRGY